MALVGVQEIQAIIYRGRLVACATRDRIFLAACFDHSLPGDSELRFVCLMGCYARDVLSGALPGPYSDQRARRYAQAALIPAELLERDLLDVRHTAGELGVPIDEFLAAQRSILQSGRPHG